jgi:hypothetical protein
MIEYEGGRPGRELMLLSCGEGYQVPSAGTYRLSPMTEQSPRAVIRLADTSERRDDAFRAIGRYVVAFSQLVAGMREILVTHITPEHEAREPINLLVSSLEAAQIADPFFALCRDLVELDAEETKIANKLEELVGAEIKERNAFAHHDWYVTRWSNPDLETPIAERIGMKASSKKNRDRREVYTPPSIDELARRVEGLRNVTWEFGTICTRQDAYDPARGRPAPRISKSLGISDGGVVIYFEGKHFVPWEPPGYDAKTGEPT